MLASTLLRYIRRHRRAVSSIEQQIYALGSCFATRSLKNIIENIVSYVQGHRRRKASREDAREPTGSSGNFEKQQYSIRF